MKQSGPTPVSTLTLSNWESWAQLKSGYGASYATLIEALRRQASGDWQTERLAAELGEGLRQGQTYRTRCPFRKSYASKGRPCACPTSGNPRVTLTVQLAVHL